MLVRIFATPANVVTNGEHLIFTFFFRECATSRIHMLLVKVTDELRENIRNVNLRITGSMQSSYDDLLNVQQNIVCIQILMDDEN